MITSKTRYVWGIAFPTLPKVSNRVLFVLNGSGKSWEGSYSDLRGHQKITRKGGIEVVIFQKFEQMQDYEVNDLDVIAIYVGSPPLDDQQTAEVSSKFNYLQYIYGYSGDWLDVDLTCNRPVSGGSQSWLHVDFCHHIGRNNSNVMMRLVPQDLHGKEADRIQEPEIEPEPIPEPIPEEEGQEAEEGVTDAINTGEE